MVKSGIVGAFVLAAGAASVTADVAPAAKAKQAWSTAAGATAAFADSAFLMKAGGDGMAEVELGRLAAERASSADVKAFAQMMVDDHSKRTAS